MSEFTNATVTGCAYTSGIGVQGTRLIHLERENIDVVRETLYNYDQWAVCFYNWLHDQYNYDRRERINIFQYHNCFDKTVVICDRKRVL